MSYPAWLYCVFDVISDKLEQNHWCAVVQTLFGSSTVWVIEK